MTNPVKAITIAASFILAAAAPAAQAPATQPETVARKAVDDIFVRSILSHRALGLPGAPALRDPAKRDAAITSSLPKLQKNYAAFAAPDPAERLRVNGRLVVTGYLLAMDDPTVVAATAKNPKLPFNEVVTELAVFLRGSPAEQSAVLDRLTATLAADPSSETAAALLFAVTGYGFPAAELKPRLATLLQKSANPDITRLLTLADAESKIASRVGQPLTLTGQTADGKPFTTADWKGKVILVDFWATWCGPCKAELPRLKDLYAKHHKEGFEILGVSSDYKLDALTSYVKNDPAMPWPHLFDPASAAAQRWHPLTADFAIRGIPVLFLIDRQGVLRSITARENLEELLPKLLAEKPQL